MTLFINLIGKNILGCPFYCSEQHHQQAYWLINNSWKKNTKSHGEFTAKCSKQFSSA